tara:strand:- start:68 stop:703 length:636 start_codon:yes stop_codon:yes gene_type:complete
MSYNRNKYKIVLFRNGERNKVFFSSNNKKSILKKYSKLIEEKKPKFITEYISRKKVMFELGIVTLLETDKDIYSKDDLGRTKKISLGNSEYNILRMVPYWKEELIYDHHTKNKITFFQLSEWYLNDKNFKQIFTLNNKLIVQTDDVFKIFSLKTVGDASRLLGIIELSFLDNGRYDCLFVPDNSTVQRKQLYNLLEGVGYSRQFLRKQYTY